MRLRHELMLFFGGLLLIFGGIVVYVNYVQLSQTLAEGLRRRLSPRSYQQLAQVEHRLLLEKAQAIALHNELGRYRNTANSFLRSESHVPEDLVLSQQFALKGQKLAPGAVVKRGTTVTKREMLNLLWAIDYEQNPWLGNDYTTMAEPLSEQDQRLRPMTEAWQALLSLQGESGETFATVVTRQSEFDLVAFCDEQGDVMTEVLRDYERHEAPLVSSLATSGLVAEVLGGQAYSTGYILYPDPDHPQGQLYLCSAVALRVGPRGDGALILGKRLDRELAEQASQVTLDAEVAILFADQVVASSDQAEKLGKNLLARGGGQLEQEQVSVDGESYLQTNLALASRADSQDAEGRIYFLKSAAEIRDEVNNQARLTLVMGGLVLVVALLLVPVVARRFTEPIATLTQAMTGVGEGVLEKLPERAISGSIEVRAAAESFNQMVIGLRQKKQLEQFVPLGTRQAVENSEGAQQTLGGQRITRTIMFSDLRGFTSMSERLEPDEVMSVLNDYLQLMTGIIRKHDGDINEYIGDAILAVFKDPVSAIRAGYDMYRALEELRETTTSEAVASLRQGIGFHTGDLVEGNIGNQGDRMKLSVIGDTVNLAARIQDRSREGQHTCIFMSGVVREHLGKEFEVAHFGDVAFKGKAEPVPVFELVTIRSS